MSVFYSYFSFSYNKQTNTDDYRAHTSCLTESERYETKPWLSNDGTTSNKQQNKNKKKKRTPQEEWMDVIQTCIENGETSSSSNSLTTYLKQMSNLENIPRKEKQFRNFTSNSLNLKGKHGTQIVTDLWNVLSKERTNRIEQRKKQEAEEEKKKQEQLQQQQEQQEQDDGTSSETNKKKKTSKVSDSSDEDSDDDDDDNNNNDTNNKKKKKKKKNEKIDEDDEEHEDVIMTTTNNKEDSSIMMNIDTKILQKEMKKTLQVAPNQCMKLKRLRKVIRKKFQLSKTKTTKKQLKKLMQQQITKTNTKETNTKKNTKDEKKKKKSKKTQIVMDGKNIILV